MADIEAFLRKAASAVTEANRALGDAVLEVGTAREQRLCFNRRLRRRDGTTQMKCIEITRRPDERELNYLDLVVVGEQL